MRYGVDRVILAVVGLSLGGALAQWLADNAALFAYPPDTAA